MIIGLVMCDLSALYMCVCVCICHYYDRQKGFIVAVYGCAPQSASSLLNICLYHLFDAEYADLGINLSKGGLYFQNVLLKLNKIIYKKVCILL